MKSLTLDQPIGFLASQIGRAVRQLVAAQVEPLGLSTQQFWTLVAISEQDAASQCALAERLRVDEATTCRVVRSLGDAGMISAVRDPGDRRRVRLELAPAGQAAVRRLLPVAREIRQVIDGALTAEERAATRTALAKVLARLNALTEAAFTATPGPATAEQRTGRPSSALPGPRGRGRRAAGTARRRAGAPAGGTPAD